MMVPAYVSLGESGHVIIVCGSEDKSICFWDASQK